MVRVLITQDLAPRYSDIVRLSAYQRPLRTGLRKRGKVIDGREYAKARAKRLAEKQDLTEIFVSMSGTIEQTFIDLLMNLYPCLQPGKGKQLAEQFQKKRERKTLSQPEKVWEKSGCASTKLAKAIIKKLLMRVRLAIDTHSGTTPLTISPGPYLLSVKASCHWALQGC